MNAVTVQAGQQIFTNVEKEQSPHHRGGHQTLFYTLASITESEVEKIEAHLLYEFAADRDPIKRVFFSVSTGKVVVAQIVPLAEREQSVRKGRRYLAHGLVFSPEEFARLGADPFCIFTHFPFMTTQEEAFQRGDFQTGNIPAVSFEVPTNSTQLLEQAKTWSSSELKKLTLLALKADQLAQEKSPIACVAEPQQVETVLAAAFFALPMRLRCRCSFDTYFYKGNLVATYYWAVGVPERPTDPRYIMIDAQSRQVMKTPFAQAETAYERWVVSLIEANDLQGVEQQKEQAFAVCEWLDGRTYDPTLLDAVTPVVVNAVFDKDASYVQQRLRRGLGEQLPPTLVDRIFQRIYRQADSTRLFQQLRRGFERSQLIDELYEAYASREFRTPEREELRVLGTVLDQEPHRLLRWVYLCWTNQQRELREILERLNTAEYQEFIRIALRYRLAEPLHFVVLGQGGSFLDVYLESNRHPTDDFVDLVKIFVKNGESQCLERLAFNVRGCLPKQLQILQKLTGKNEDIPTSFRRAVDDACSAAPKSGGMKGFLRSLFGFPSKQNTEK